MYEGATGPYTRLPAGHHEGSLTGQGDGKHAAQFGYEPFLCDVYSLGKDFLSRSIVRSFITSTHVNRVTTVSHGCCK